MRRGIQVAFLAAMLIATALAGCKGDDPEEVARNKAKQKAAKAAANNECETDDECRPTGCRGSICHAAEDERFCLHRMIVELLAEGSASDELLDALRSYVSAPLTEKERETLRVEPLGRSILLSFHAPLQQRERVATLLAELDSGGIHHPHPDADVVLANASRDGLGEGVTARRAQGAGMLLETRIESGEVLSRDDVMAARSRLEVELPPAVVPADARVAFEPLLGDSPVLRAWIVERNPAVDFGRVIELAVEPRPERVTLAAELDEEGREALAAATEASTGRALVFVLGQDVLAAPVVAEPMRDGRFSLDVARRGSDDTTIVERLDRLSVAPLLASGLVLDRVATADAERDNKCYSADPPLATCGCVQGRCAWAGRSALDACIDTGELEPTTKSAVGK